MAIKTFVLTRTICSNEYIDKPEYFAVELTDSLVDTATRLKLIMGAESVANMTKGDESFNCFWMTQDYMESIEEEEIEGDFATVEDAMTDTARGGTPTIKIEESLLKDCDGEVGDSCFRGGSATFTSIGAVRFSVYEKYTGDDVFSTEFSPEYQMNKE